MFKVEVVINFITFFFPNDSWKLGFGFGVAAKKRGDMEEKKLKLLLGV